MRELTELERQLAYRFAHLLLPDDAIDCDPWDSHGHGDWRRFFITREWDVAGLWVSVAGEQNHHGGITRWMHVGGEHRCTASDREQLIAAVREAATLLDALTSREPKTLGRGAFR